MDHDFSMGLKNTGTFVEIPGISNHGPGLPGENAEIYLTVYQSLLQNFFPRNQNLK
jgi:hypothetical protein